MNLPKTATITVGDHTFEHEIEYGTAIISDGDTEAWDHDGLWLAGDRQTPDEAWAEAQRQWHEDEAPEGDRLVLVWRFPDRGNDSWFTHEPVGGPA